MRALLLGLLTVAAVAHGQALTATASFDFSVTTPLPVDSLTAGITGGGTINVGCSACAVASNSHKYAFDTVDFLYENAPQDAPARTVSGVNADPTVGTWPYQVTSLPPGTRLFPRLRGARCSCGNGAQVSTKVDVDRPGFTVNPYLMPLSLVYRASGGTASPSQLPVGESLRVAPTCVASPKSGESVRVHVLGAGADVTQDFPTPSDATSTGATFTAQSAGTLTVTCSLLPYGAESNPQTMTAVVASGSGGGQGGAGGGSSQEPKTGCSTAPGALMVATALALLIRRRR